MAQATEWNKFADLLNRDCVPTPRAAPTRKAKSTADFKMILTQLPISAKVIADHILALITSGVSIGTSISTLVAAITKLILAAPAQLVSSLLGLLTSITFPGFEAFSPDYALIFSTISGLVPCDINITFPTVMGLLLLAITVAIIMFIDQLITWLVSQILRFITNILNIINDVRSWWACIQVKIGGMLTKIYEAFVDDAQDPDKKSRTRAEIISALRPYYQPVINTWKAVGRAVDRFIALLLSTPSIVTAEYQKCMTAIKKMMKGRKCMAKTTEAAQKT